MVTRRGRFLLELRRVSDGVTRFDDQVVAGAPGFIVEQELEHDGAGRLGHRQGPVVAGHAIHGHAFFPAQARAFAADEQGVAESDVDLGRDGGDNGFGLRLLHGGPGDRLLRGLGGRFGGFRRRGERLGGLGFLVHGDT